MLGTLRGNLIVITVYLGFTQANVLADEVRDFQNIIRAMNEFRPNVQAGSAGAFGQSLAASIDTVTINRSNTYSNYHLGIKRDEEITIQRIHWQRGTMWPIDIGFALGQDSNHKLTSWHAYVQHSLFEKFRRPSLVVRGFYQQLYSFHNLSSRNSGVELATGFTLLSFLSAYINFGLHELEQRFDEISYSDSLGLVRINETVRRARNLNHHLRYGAKLRLYFSWLHFHVEDQWQGRESNAHRNPTLSLHLGY